MLVLIFHLIMLLNLQVLLATTEVQLKGSHAHRREHVKHHLHCRAFRL